MTAAPSTTEDPARPRRGTEAPPQCRSLQGWAQSNTCLRRPESALIVAGRKKRLKLLEARWSRTGDLRSGWKRLSVFWCPGPTRVVTALSRKCRAKTGALVVIHPKNEQSATKQFNRESRSRWRWAAAQLAQIECTSRCRRQNRPRSAAFVMDEDEAAVRSIRRARHLLGDKPPSTPMEQHDRMWPNSDMLPLFDDVSATISVGGNVRTRRPLRSVEPVRGYRRYFLCPQTKLISGEMSCRSTFRVVVSLQTP